MKQMKDIKTLLKSILIYVPLGTVCKVMLDIARDAPDHGYYGMPPVILAAGIVGAVAVSFAAAEVAHEWCVVRKL